jgi:hypothetical protein
VRLEEVRVVRRELMSTCTQLGQIDACGLKLATATCWLVEA